jgi:hypothetical protein
MTTYGTNLVSIHNAEENLFVSTKIGWGDRGWIGYNDIWSEGNFSWYDGSQSDYTRWAP